MLDGTRFQVTSPWCEWNRLISTQEMWFYMKIIKRMLSNSCEVVPFCFLTPSISTTLTKQAARKSKILRERENTEKLGMFHHVLTDVNNVAINNPHHLVSNASPAPVRSSSCSRANSRKTWNIWKCVWLQRGFSFIFLREKQKGKMVPTIFLLLIIVLNKNPKFVVCLRTLWLKRLFLSLNRD